MAFSVEERDTFWFVVDREAGVELVTVFDYEITAREICAKANARYSSFQSIPEVPVDSPYPRTHTIIPGPYPRKVEI
jgi:hypothetical protein